MSGVKLGKAVEEAGGAVWRREFGFIQTRGHAALCLLAVVLPVICALFEVVKFKKDDWGTKRDAMSVQRITEDETAMLFDDAWTPTAPQTTNWPGYYPKQVTQSWTLKPSCSASSCPTYSFVSMTSADGHVKSGVHYQPDRVFDQCTEFQYGIQFREIAHLKCEVPPELLHPFAKWAQCDTTGLPGDFGFLKTYVMDECLPPELWSSDIVKVMFTGHLSRPGCAQVVRGVEDGGWVGVGPLAADGILSHELGHALGLGHFDPTVENNLMRAVPATLPTVHELFEDQCLTAYNNASLKHNSYW